jgi:predicted DNA-binding transcriptional regulator AlpA
MQVHLPNMFGTICRKCLGDKSMAPNTEIEIKANEKNTGAPVRRFLRLYEVKRATGLGHATIYEWMARGDFPKPVPLVVGASAGSMPRS